MFIVNCSFYVLLRQSQCSVWCDWTRLGVYKNQIERFCQRQSQVVIINVAILFSFKYAKEMNLFMRVQWLWSCKLKALWMIRRYQQNKVICLEIVTSSWKRHNNFLIVHVIRHKFLTTQSCHLKKFHLFMYLEWIFCFK